jgi:hypothetical protein
MIAPAICSYVHKTCFGGDSKTPIDGHCQRRSHSSLPQRRSLSLRFIDDCFKEKQSHACLPLQKASPFCFVFLMLDDRRQSLRSRALSDRVRQRIIQYSTSHACHLSTSPGRCSVLPEISHRDQRDSLASSVEHRSHQELCAARAAFHRYSTIESLQYDSFLLLHYFTTLRRHCSD